ncbi:hypothetical protein AGRA3207_004006 [Actinomadura graeca]|uniref:Translation initiation factor IF-2 n=1 Tax=Actinomadura graeca TaxID=2750812 RepID=A0ABX8QVR7_9ACTN|nr:hypothetical protein [Actinomadura graeca]QXJ22926.1 hypothetical protein AGRA3207_004006 [Actinomadura graeca]
MISDAPARRPLPDEAPDAPAVFADPSGRRRRLVRRLGLGAGTLLVLYLGALGVGVATGADVPLTTWDDPPGTHRVNKGGRDDAATREGEGRGTGRPGAGRSGGGAGAPTTVPSPTATRTSVAVPPARPAPPGSSTPPGAGTPTGRPGNSHASPPRWGHEKKPR